MIELTKEQEYRLRCNDVLGNAVYTLINIDKPGLSPDQRVDILLEELKRVANSQFSRENLLRVAIKSSVKP